MTLIYCKCGCGQQREELDSQGHKRQYIKGHQCIGRIYGLKTRSKDSNAHKGEKNYNWKGGYTLRKIRGRNKRRGLGSNLINVMVEDDFVCHHLTTEYVAYIPEFINKTCYHNIHTGKGMDEVNFYALNYLFLVYNKEE